MYYNTKMTQTFLHLLPSDLDKMIKQYYVPDVHAIKNEKEIGFLFTTPEFDFKIIGDFNLFPLEKIEQYFKQDRTWCELALERLTEEQIIRQQIIRQQKLVIFQSSEIHTNSGYFDTKTYTVKSCFSLTFFNHNWVERFHKTLSNIFELPCPIPNDYPKDYKIESVVSNSRGIEIKTTLFALSIYFQLSKKSGATKRNFKKLLELIDKDSKETFSVGLMGNNGDRLVWQNKQLMIQTYLETLTFRGRIKEIIINNIRDLKDERQ